MCPPVLVALADTRTEDFASGALFHIRTIKPWSAKSIIRETTKISHPEKL